MWVVSACKMSRQDPQALQHIAMGFLKCFVAFCKGVYSLAQVKSGHLQASIIFWSLDMSLVSPSTQVTEDSESHRRTLIESTTYRLMCLKHSPVSFVLAFFEGLLGSPVPTALLAKTLNSYSTQGLSSITVAVRCVPPTTSGTGTKQNTHILWDEPPREPARAPCTLTQTRRTARVSSAQWDNRLRR